MEKWRLVYLAKNMKALCLPSKETAADDLKFLRKRFRYRRIGILSSLAAPLIPTLSEPLIIIDEQELAPFPQLCGVNPVLAQLLPISSLFMVPVLTSIDWRPELGPHFCWLRRYARPFNHREFRFILRLLTYVPVDLAEREEEKMMAALKKGEWEAYVQSRRRQLISDAEKRFWRWPEESDGEVRIGIIDPAPYLASSPRDDDIPFIFPTGFLFLPSWSANRS